ncbi:hypothetical protein U9R90_25555 [Streptomyces sp. E11-3]|uniref:hypothetical protein n=1 Tax=Streptomyces sp. E11-3 TaxID=3110112 RepID=UPI003981803B
MGWAVLYIAFGVVALWLLGEVLLQYKARLRWRMLAFVGFVGVVFGVLLQSLLVIGVGTAAFAIGQTYVTLSFRRGFSTGWAIGGSPGESRRRKTRGEAEQDPTLEVSDLEYDAGYGPEQPPMPDRDYAEPMDHLAPPSPVYAPEPLPEDTGQYGIYQDADYPPQPAAASAAGEYGYSGYDQQQYGYDTGAQQQYAAYSDPYIGTQTYDTQTYGGQSPYAPYAGDQQGYGTGYQDPYGGAAYPGAAETPPGGVWVPQQRDSELQPEQPPPYQDGYGAGYQNEQQPYRY